MENEWLRYSCQLVLPGFGAERQQRLHASKVLVVGAGGLGCPVAQYLVAAGVGTVGIADYDTVSIGNLHRQFLYTPAEVGQKKAPLAAAKLQQQNPLVHVVPHDLKLTSANVMAVLANYDLVVDGTDNFDTRYLLNDACVLQDKPLVYGAIYQYEGQVAVWNVPNQDGTRSPNYRDVFAEVDALRVPNCAEGGVIPPLAGIIGCMQANEVIKYLTGSDDVLAGKLLVYDAQSAQSRVIKIGHATSVTIPSLQDTETIPTITVEALRRALEESAVALVDVRSPEEREAFHIGGRHVPAGEIENGSLTFESSLPVVLYCASGKRSAEAVKRLRGRYPAIAFLSLEGGLKAWKEAAQG